MYASRFVPLLQRSAVVTVAVVFHTKVVHSDKSKDAHDHKVAHEHVLKSLRPNPEEYDPFLWDTKKNEKIVKHNALLETLHGDDLVETYEVYKHKTNQEIYVVLKFGKRLNGYPGILHGGKKERVPYEFDTSFIICVVSLCRYFGTGAGQLVWHAVHVARIAASIHRQSGS